MTQKQLIKKHFKTHSTINPDQADKMYGIKRLAARAGELGLISRMVEGTNRYGKKVRYAEYRLPSGGAV